MGCKRLRRDDLGWRLNGAGPCSSYLAWEASWAVISWPACWRPGCRERRVGGAGRSGDQRRDRARQPGASALRFDCGGPAFEGARISMGMRAATGAIWRVAAREGQISCEVLGSVPPRGICGSGLVDAVAAALDLGLIRSTGRLASGEEALPLAAPVSLTQTDIRQLQLPKGRLPRASVSCSIGGAPRRRT